MINPDFPKNPSPEEAMEQRLQEYALSLVKAVLKRKGISGNQATYNTITVNESITVPTLTVTQTFISPGSSTTIIGIVALATSAETTTGTDATKAITPDGLAGSDYGKRIIEVIVIDSATALAVGDGKAYFFIPSELNGYNLVDADACVNTVSSSGLPTIQIANVTDAVDMLSTKITIDVSEKTSYTAATQPVIDTAKDDVVTGDELRIDLDVAGTGTKGLAVILSFQLP